MIETLKEHTADFCFAFRAGDAVDGLLAFLLTRTARGFSDGLDPWVQKRMMANVAFDIIIGLTPVLGDIADMLYRCNTRNTVLLEKMLKDRAKKAMRAAEEEYKLHHERRSDESDLHSIHMARIEDGNSSRATPQGSVRRLEMQEQLKKSGWTGGFGGKASVKKSGTASKAPAPAQSNARQQPNGNAKVEGGRFVNARDLL